MINEINKNIFNIKTLFYLIQMRKSSHKIFKILNYIKNIHLEIENKIVKTTKFNII